MENVKKVIKIAAFTLFTLVLVMNLLLGLLWLNGFYYTGKFMGVVTLIGVILLIIKTCIEAFENKADEYAEYEDDDEEREYHPIPKEPKGDSNHPKKENYDMYTTDALEVLLTRAKLEGNVEKEKEILEAYERRLEAEKKARDTIQKLEDDKKETSKLLKKYDPSEEDDFFTSQKEEPEQLKIEIPDEKKPEQIEIVLPVEHKEEEDELDEYDRKLQSLFQTDKNA